MYLGIYCVCCACDQLLSMECQQRGPKETSPDTHPLHADFCRLLITHAYFGFIDCAFYGQLDTSELDLLGIGNSIGIFDRCS